ncbi:Hyaluronan and proteoglycan link protein 2 [Oryzias melastigma]|uniref:Hyaluronan and proteoglycan link protein 2 n=1 Tax=Oryzias melastigma TaxID=30732 RepID=A0A834CW94_ORYME|nr:Hyaluronan and proteoglycan link protein 2 [Oryzias melastigma]
MEAGFWSGGGPTCRRSTSSGTRPLDSDLQHPSFRDRVFLTEDGGPSVVLENVDIGDSGTYWCRVLQEGGGAQPDSGPISTVQLLVVPELELIQAESGQSVTLPCRAEHVDPQVSVTWSRHDLEPQEVLLIQGGVVQGQHPSFRNRLEVGRWAELGDLSVTLKNVMPEDSGTYECRAVLRGGARRRRSSSDPDPISSVYLSVSPAAAGSAHNGAAEDGLPLALTAGAFTAGAALGAAAAAVLAVFLRRSGKQNRIPGLQRECAVV